MVEVYDPKSGRWLLAAQMAAARSSHAAVALQNGQVLVLDGNGTDGTERYGPAWLLRGRDQLMAGPAIHVVSNCAGNILAGGRLIDMPAN